MTPRLQYVMQLSRFTTDNSVMFGESNIINIAYDSVAELWIAGTSTGNRQTLTSRDLYSLFARLGAILDVEMKVK